MESNFSNGASANSFVYNPATGSWTAIAPLPQARADASAVTDGVYIYILNGMGDDSPDPLEHNTLYRYNPANNSYSTLAAAPLATTSQAAVYLNGKIYRIAGNTGSLTASVDVYTISSNSWAAPGSESSYPQALEGLAAVAWGNFIYVGGGMDPDLGASQNTYRYDPGAKTWNDAIVTDLPSARDNAAVGLLNGLWIIAGGDGTASASGLNLQNPLGSWTNLPAMPQTRFYLSGAASNTKFVAVGGADMNGDYTRDTQQYGCP